MRRSVFVSPLCPTHFPAFSRKRGLHLFSSPPISPPFLSADFSPFSQGFSFFLSVPCRYYYFPKYYPFSLFPPSPLFPSYLSLFFSFLLTLNIVDPWTMQVWILNCMGLPINFFFKSLILHFYTTSSWSYPQIWMADYKLYSDFFTARRIHP